MGDFDPVYRGREGLVRYYRQWIESWPNIRVEPQEIIDLGERVFLRSDWGFPEPHARTSVGSKSPVPLRAPKPVHLFSLKKEGLSGIHRSLVPPARVKHCSRQAACLYLAIWLVHRFRNRRRILFWVCFRRPSWFGLCSPPSDGRQCREAREVRMPWL